MDVFIYLAANPAGFKTRRDKYFRRSNYLPASFGTRQKQILAALGAIFQ
jgi:hypothetical protein